MASIFENHCTDTDHWQLIMGRTVLPYSQVWEAERQRWQKFRRALRKEDQAHLDRLFESARLHLQAGVYASNPWPLESMLLSMLLEHQKDLMALEERLQSLEEPDSANVEAPGGSPLQHRQDACATSLNFRAKVRNLPGLPHLKDWGWSLGERSKGVYPLPLPQNHLT